MKLLLKKKNVKKAINNKHRGFISGKFKVIPNSELEMKTPLKQYHQPNLIVIHGVGSGKLKDEIHEILKTKKEVKTFVNQYHPNFGYGATEVYFGY